MAPTSTGLSLLRTLLLSVSAIAVFFLIDTVLSRTERSESRAAAARAYEEGTSLMKQGRFLDAVGQFDEAISLARENPAYPLARAQALLAAGHLPEAEDTLAELLQNNATAGAPNLAMARVLAKEGKFTDAVAYYHRAIYGRWTSEPARNRVQARSELVDFLMANHSTDGLLAELLPLEQEAPRRPCHAKTTCPGFYGSWIARPRGRVVPRCPTPSAARSRRLCGPRGSRVCARELPRGTRKL